MRVSINDKQLCETISDLKEGDTFMFLEGIHKHQIAHIPIGRGRPRGFENSYPTLDFMKRTKPNLKVRIFPVGTVITIEV